MYPGPHDDHKTRSAKKAISPTMTMIQPTVLTLTDPGFVGCTASARMKPTTVTINPIMKPMAALCPRRRNQTAEVGSGSGSGLAARVELQLEGAAQQLAAHVARPARDRLRLLADDADDLAAPLAVAAGIGLRLANRGGFVPPPTTEERTEPPKHAASVAERRDGG